MYGPVFPWWVRWALFPFLALEWVRWRIGVFWTLAPLQEVPLSNDVLNDRIKLTTALAGWSIGRRGLDRAWVVKSPTYDTDGMVVEGSTADDVLERVAMLHAWGWRPARFHDGGLVPDTGELAKVTRDSAIPVSALEDMEPLAEELNDAPVEPQPSLDELVTEVKPEPVAVVVEMPVQGASIAKAMGYTGNPCGACGGWKVRPNGTCTLCDDCGATTGCS